jgi:hypothetical protein
VGVSQKLIDDDSVVPRANLQQLVEQALHLEDGSVIATAVQRSIVLDEHKKQEKPINL